MRPPLGRAAIALAAATLSAVSCASSGPPPRPVHQPPEPPPPEPPEPRLDLGSIPRPVQIVAPEPSIVIPAEAYAAATVPIVDPSGAMAHFHQRLEAVARGRAGTLARIAVYSDSFNGADLVTSNLRRALQARFGDGGKGFVPIAPGWPSQRHQDVDWDHHRDWLTYVVNRGRGPGDRYGLGGVMAYNRTRRSRARFATVEGSAAGAAVSRFRLFYQAWPRGGTLEMAVDDGAPVTISTDADVVEDRVAELEVADGPHALEVRAVEGRLRLYGVVMERPGPGVVVDALMLIGARGRRLVLFDGDHLARQVALRQTDLLIFWLGGNDAESSYFDREGFLADYGAGIDAARAERSEVSCLVVSTPDMGESPGGRTRRRVDDVVEAERELALAHGCAFFDFFEAMGGAGTMRQWYRARPRLVSGDYTHPTLSGAEVAAELLHAALLRSFAEALTDEENALSTETVRE